MKLVECFTIFPFAQFKNGNRKMNFVQIRRENPTSVSRSQHILSQCNVNVRAERMCLHYKQNNVFLLDFEKLLLKVRTTHAASKSVVVLDCLSNNIASCFASKKVIHLDVIKRNAHNHWITIKTSKYIYNLFLIARIKQMVPKWCVCGGWFRKYSYIIISKTNKFISNIDWTRIKRAGISKIEYTQSHCFYVWKMLIRWQIIIYLCCGCFL